MPGHKLHAYHDRSCFGKSYWKLHREMDKPVFFLGRRHRELFHDPVSAYAIASKLYPGDPNALEAAAGHILLDDLCTRNPLFKRQLEVLAKSEGKKKRRKEPLPKELVPVLKDLEKLEEAKRLIRIFYSLN